MSEVQDVNNGYVKSWYVDPDLSTRPDALVLIIAIISMITAEIVVIGFYIYFHRTIKSFIHSKTQPYYYYFWAVQALVVVLLLIALPAYLSKTQHNIAIAPYFYLISMIIHFLAASTTLYVTRKDGSISVPFETWACNCCTKECCCKWRELRRDGICTVSFEKVPFTCLSTYRWIMNLLGLTLTFFLVSYVLQALPNILIAYYSYPSRSLATLSFLQIALACLVLNVAGIIFLLEKLGWLCYVRIKRRAPPGIQDTDSELMNLYLPKSVKKEDVEGNKNSYYDETMNVQENTKSAKIKIKKSDIVKVCLQIVALFFVLATISVVLVLVGTIVFKQTTDDNDSLHGLLTTIPTVLGNILLYFTRRRMFDTKHLQLNVKKDQDTKTK